MRVSGANRFPDPSPLQTKGISKNRGRSQEVVCSESSEGETEDTRPMTACSSKFEEVTEMRILEPTQEEIDYVKWLVNNHMELEDEREMWIFTEYLR